MQAQTSRYHGVRLNKRTQKWEAYIRVAGKHVHLGCYDGEVAAAQARSCPVQVGRVQAAKAAHLCCLHESLLHQPVACAVAAGTSVVVSEHSVIALWVQAFDQAALVRQAHNLGAMGGKPQLVTNFPPMMYLVCSARDSMLQGPVVLWQPI